MTRDQPKEVLQLAGDIIAKCVAKGTVGALYVPRDVCKRAFDKTEHGHFDEAVAHLDASGFLIWHKGTTCFGLNPEAYMQAVQFAIDHASAKRRGVLEQRFESRRSANPNETIVGEEEQDWDDEPVTRSDVLAILKDYVPLSTHRNAVQELTRLAHAANPHHEASPKAPDEAVLKEMREDMLALYNKQRAMDEKYAQLRSNLESMTPTMRVLEDKLDAFNAEMKAARERDDLRPGQACNICRRATATTSIKEWVWERIDKVLVEDPSSPGCPVCDSCYTMSRGGIIFIERENMADAELIAAEVAKPERKKGGGILPYARSPQDVEKLKRAINKAAGRTIAMSDTKKIPRRQRFGPSSQG